jgi:hypothetical protein
MKTYQQLNKDINDQQNKLAQMHATLQAMPGSPFIAAAMNNYMDSFQINDFADFLVIELQQRDEPMLESDIREIFIVSGFEFDDRHISDCSPDTQDTVNEQIAYYRE